MQRISHRFGAIVAAAVSLFTSAFVGEAAKSGNAAVPHQEAAPARTKGVGIRVLPPTDEQIRQQQEKADGTRPSMFLYPRRRIYNRKLIGALCTRLRKERARRGIGRGRLAA